MTTYRATARLTQGTEITTYTARAITKNGTDITTFSDTPTRAAWLLADTLSKAGTPIETETYQKLLRRGFVHLGYDADGRELFYAVDSVVE